MREKIDTIDTSIDTLYRYFYTVPCS